MPKKSRTIAGDVLRFRDSTEAALEKLYSAQTWLMKNKHAWDEFGSRVERLIEDMEREL